MLCLAITTGTVVCLYRFLFLSGSCDLTSEGSTGSQVGGRYSVGYEAPHQREMRVPESVYNISNHRTLYNMPGLELYIHTAFLDDRFHQAIVRVFALQKKDEIKQDYRCRWDTTVGGIPVKSEVKANHIIIDPSWPQWSPYFATTFDCHFPGGSKPRNIQLISKDEKYSFHLPVERTLRTPKRGTLAVCVKPVTGQFKVSRLVEWFEMMQLAGVKDIILYNTDIIGSARFVLDYYKSTGLLKTVPFPFMMSILQHVDSPPMQSGAERYAVYQQTYFVAMHDCLYRFRGLYETLLFIDVDEILLPTQANMTIIDVVNFIRKYYIFGAGYLFKTAWHFEEKQKNPDSSIPDFMYMQKHSMGTIPTDNQPKSVIVTDRAISVNFHSVLDVPSKKYSNELLPWENTGYIHHFRGSCDVKFEDWRCKDLLSKYREDPVLPRYMEDLKYRMTKVLDLLELH